MIVVAENKQVPVALEAYDETVSKLMMREYYARLPGSGKSAWDHGNARCEGDNDPDFDEACGSGECVFTKVRTTTKYHITGNGIIDIAESNKMRLGLGERASCCHPNDICFWTNVV